MKTQGMQTQEQSSFARRGRKKLTTDNSLLFDAFCEHTAAKFSNLKLYFSHESGTMKIFTHKSQYPYKIAKHIKEFEIVNNDITKGIEEGNNSRQLFDKYFENFNKEFDIKFNNKDIEMKKEIRTLPKPTQ
jgi:hypothetical protein